MPRSYRHIEQYEKEIIELRKDGYTNREVGEKFGFTREQIRGFIKRYNHKQQRIEAGVALKKKGRPPKNYVVPEAEKINELKYIISRKEARIKTLEMENKLMRDFLSLTERK